MINVYVVIYLKSPWMLYQNPTFTLMTCNIYMIYIYIYILAFTPVLVFELLCFTFNFKLILDLNSQYSILVFDVLQGILAFNRRKCIIFLGKLGISQ